MVTAADSEAEQLAALDAQQRAEEAESLTAIYGDDCFIEQQAGSTVVKMHVPSRDAEQQIVLRALLPNNYPSAAPPVLELHASHRAPEDVAAAIEAMEQQFVPGEVVLFAWCEWLREWHSEWQEQHEVAAAAAVSTSGNDSEDEQLPADLLSAPEATHRARQREAEVAVAAEEEAAINAMAQLIVSDEPFLEKKSTFQAHVAPVTSVAQVHAVVAALLRNNKIRNATHNMMAYRIEQPEHPGNFLQDCDDDGEAAAGGRLLHMLQVADVRNVVVVVSRWFGGVLLGPARFTYINNAARNALVRCDYLPAKGSGQGPGGQGQQGTGAAMGGAKKKRR